MDKHGARNVGLDTMRSLRQGDRVHTPRGAGVVLYVRMSPPTFTQPAAVSVSLDERAGAPGYNGTMFSPEEVMHAGKPS